MKKNLFSVFAIMCMLMAPVFAVQTFAQTAEETVAATVIDPIKVEAPAHVPAVAPAAEVAALEPEKTVIVKAESPADVTDEAFFQSLISAIGSMQGLGTMGILALLIQLAVKFLSAPLSGKTFKQLTGKTKITVIVVLSCLGSLVALVAQGMDWKAAIVSGVGLAAISSMVQQLWVQYLGDKSNA